MSQSSILLEAGTNELELVEFYIDERFPDTEQPYRGHYGVNVAKVLEIIRTPKISPMPDQPHDCVLGAFDLRNHIIPLVDLALLLGMDRVEDAEPRVIVAEFNNVQTAFLVSGVTRIHRISWKEIEPPGEHVAHFSSENITGVVRQPDHLMLILDMEKIVAELSPATAMRVEEDALEELALHEECYKALVADDSDAIRKLMVTVLSKAGFEVTATHNGREAWDTLLAAKARGLSQGQTVSDWFDVVVSDIEMPSMDGHTLCRRIKEDAYLRDVPVVLFSSLITDKLRHKGDSVGADEQIAKPEIGRLAEVALGLIASRRSRKA
ncbi:chemotaxis protein [Paucidesulfovibrio longus]|uniref:chemotaxis protein n=1 Tax=Paucidesulfovibrio longus TaxID=889 RepID=UPI00048753BA|nr:chemotaxis protein [Paucidesulfovibrio longus]